MTSIEDIKRELVIAKLKNEDLYAVGGVSTNNAWVLITQIRYGIVFCRSSSLVSSKEDIFTDINKFPERFNLVLKPKRVWNEKLKRVT